jgi:RNA polymerase sigma factor (sigma-70 family)
MRALRQRSSFKEVPAPDEDVASTVNGGQPLECAVFPQPAESQEQAVARHQLRRRLALHLKKLNAERRMAVVLRWLHGYSLKEIAEFTDASVNTVRDRLQVGKKQLQKAIARDPAFRDWTPGGMK